MSCHRHLDRRCVHCDNCRAPRVRRRARENQLHAFEAIERRFAWQARRRSWLWVERLLYDGALDLWAVSDGGFLVDARHGLRMAVVRVILFVAEPFILHRHFHKWRRQT